MRKKALLRTLESHLEGKINIHNRQMEGGDEVGEGIEGELGDSLWGCLMGRMDTQSLSDWEGPTSSSSRQFIDIKFPSGAAPCPSPAP